VRIHREGYTSLALIGSMIAVLNLIALIMSPRRVFWLIFSFSTLIFGFFTQFFRNPMRYPPSSEGCIISPADGTVVAIEKIYESEYFHEERMKISIFMSVVSVHLNRVPINGKVIFYRYHPGKYLMAFHPKSSELNERNTTVIETDKGERILIRQIAGILARRICYYLREGQDVIAGQELGFIKFGSRCDVFLPLDATINVTINQKVKGSETILAKL
jgi:phosphatidylserine decarboxylase